MTLLELLRQELPKRGGWPEGVCEISTHASGRVFFDGRFAPRGFTLPMASDAWNKYKHPRSYTNAVTREQYEAALAASKRCDHKWIPSEGRTQSGYLCSKCGNYDGPGYDWIDWGGGECPVSASEMVDVIFGHGGRMSTNIADCWRWNHSGNDSDIIAYRLHQPQEVEMIPLDECDGSRAEDDLNECIGQDATPVWNGEGLPPVGVECECQFRGGWQKCNILFSGNQIIVLMIDGDEYPFEPKNTLFRPIDKKRNDAIADMLTIIDCNGVDPKNSAIQIYDAIAAGKIPGVKLEV